MSKTPSCAYCETTKGLRVAGCDHNGRPDDFICADCFTGTDTGPCFDDLPKAATVPAYRHGLTIEVRDGIWCVTNDFGGRIIHHCLDLDDAIEMRERVAIGFPADVVALVAALDATKNRAHAAAQVVKELTGSEPFRFRAHRSNLIRYAVECPAGTFDGEAYDDEPHAEAVAMERLMSAVCASLPQTQTEAA